MIYLTSDIHFFHDNIMGYTGRSEAFKSIEEYSEGFIRMCKSLKKSDTLLFMGDMAHGWKKNTQGLKILWDMIDCHKVLIKGNHDLWATDYDLKYFGFEKVYDYIIYKDILFCHYPLTKQSLKNMPYEHQYLANIIHKTTFDVPSWVDMKRYNKALKSDIKIIYHGHSHNNSYPDEYKDGFKRINVCVDRIPTQINPLIPIDIPSHKLFK